MKHSILTLAATLLVVQLAHSQEQKSTKDAETAFQLYKERLSEGGKPTLTITNGESKITESTTTTMYPGEYTGEKSGPLGSHITDFVPGPSPKPSVCLAQVQALKDQVETLKKLNAELEKALAACTSKP